MSIDDGKAVRKDPSREADEILSWLDSREGNIAFSLSDGASSPADLLSYKVYRDALGEIKSGAIGKMSSAIIFEMERDRRSIEKDEQRLGNSPVSSVFLDNAISLAREAKLVELGTGREPELRKWADDLAGRPSRG